MLSYAVSILPALVAGVAAYDPHTFSNFAVMGFSGTPLTEGCVDPIVSSGKRSSHAHTIIGASGFGTTVTGEQLTKSSCTNADIDNDKSVYWVPKVYFQDPKTGELEDVKLYYSKVYYFMEETDDVIHPFPLGLEMLSGDAMRRTAPASGGNLVLDPKDGEIQPVQWTCPRTSYSPASYPDNSDGTTAGIGDTNNKGAGSGFPLYPCDGQYSPLRADIHFPSCYKEGASLTDYKNNVAWPSSKNAGPDGTVTGRKNCPSGYIHVPHMFFEFYWNTIDFASRWTPDGKNQPFVLANGDRTGFSLHADFVSGWEEDTLAELIYKCDGQHAGFGACADKVPSVRKNTNGGSCQITSPVVDVLTGKMAALPCNNPLSGWGVGDSSSNSTASTAEDAAAVQDNSNTPAQTSAAAEASASASSSSPNVEAQDAGQDYGGVFNEGASAAAKTTTAQELPATTAAAAATISSAPEGDHPGVYVVWVTETITRSTTVYVDGPEATAVKRSHVHEHGRMHKRLGFAGRR